NEADGPDRRSDALAAFDLGRTSAQRAVARQLRYRVSDSVRVHRHVYLRELRACARTAGAEPDGSRLRVLRVSAFDLHHTAGRTRGRALRHAADILGRAGARRGRTAAVAA